MRFSAESNLVSSNGAFQLYLPGKVVLFFPRGLVVDGHSESSPFTLDADFHICHAAEAVLATVLIYIRLLLDLF